MTRCECKTQKGVRCANNARPHTKYCGIHKGGRCNSSPTKKISPRSSPGGKKTPVHLAYGNAHLYITSKKDGLFSSKKPIEIRNSLMSTIKFIREDYAQTNSTARSMLKLEKNIEKAEKYIEGIFFSHFEYDFDEVYSISRVSYHP